MLRLSRLETQRLAQVVVLVLDLLLLAIATPAILVFTLVLPARQARLVIAVALAGLLLVLVAFAARAPTARWSLIAVGQWITFLCANIVVVQGAPLWWLVPPAVAALVASWFAVRTWVDRPRPQTP